MSQTQTISDAESRTRTKSGPSLLTYFQKVIAIANKDILAELRTKEMLSAMFVFSLLVIFIFNFAFDLRAQDPLTLAPRRALGSDYLCGRFGIGPELYRGT